MINTFTSGLNLDVSPRFLDKSSYSYALNAVLESDTGNQGSIINELGNDLCQTINGNIMGHVILDDNSFLIITDTNIIATLNPTTKAYEEIINAPCLNITNPVSILFRIRKGCERTIYLTDGTNPHRTINLDSLNDYIVDGEWDCDLFSTSPSVELPCASLVRVNDSGGQIELGSVSFHIRYMDEDLNTSNWFELPFQVTIVDDILNAPYNTIDGGTNLLTDPETEDLTGVPISNKSVEILLEGLDQSYKYYQIAHVQSISATGAPSQITHSFPQAITQTNYTFTGLNNGGILSSLDDIVVDEQIIDIANHHVQLDNRLILAGESTQSYDWAQVQRAANTIRIGWCEKVQPDSSKLPTYTPSYMRDEIQAFAIVGKLKNSSQTFAFHIPGRTSTAFDLADVDGQPRWKVENTASFQFPNQYGTMSYIECGSDYPDVLDCNGERIYPEGPVRHHKFPDTCLSPLTREPSSPIELQSKDVVSLGINVNITEFLTLIPEALANNIESWHVVSAVPTEQDHTVLDKGIYFNAKTRIEYLDETVSISRQDDVYNPSLSTDRWEPNLRAGFFLSPEVLFNRRFLNGTHYKFIKKLSSTWENTIGRDGIRVPGIFDYDFSEGLKENFGQTVGINNSVFVDPPELADVPIGESPFIGTSTVTADLNGTTIHNANFSHHVFYSQLAEDISEDHSFSGRTERAFYTSIKRDVDPFCNLYALTYTTAFNLNCIEDGCVYGGDSYISKFQMASIESVTPGSGKAFYRFYVESRINTGLRSSSTDPLVNYYKGSTDPELIDYLNPNRELADGEVRVYKPEFFSYNADYSRQRIEKPYFPIPLAFDFCSECLNEYPFRIRYSKRSYQEELADNYEVFLQNDYRDLDGSTGIITNLFIDKDQLYAATEKASWFIPTRPQQIQTDASTAYIGIGDVLSVPPKKLSTTNYAYGGSQDKWSFTSTEFGTFYMDQLQNKFFHLSDKLTEISDKGLRNWFEENTDLQLTKAFPSANNPYKHAGFITTYDSRHRRVILTKRDYKPLFDDMTFDGTYFRNVGGVIVPLGEPSYFENLSSTISYSVPHQKWASFHSYVPNYYMNNHETFFSQVNTNFGGLDFRGVYEHNAGSYQTYYNSKKPFIIEYTQNEEAVMTKVFDSLTLYSQTYEQISNNIYKERNGVVPFTGIISYNENQSTGYHPLSLETDLLPINDTDLGEGVSVDYVEDHYRISNLRDYTSDLTFWTEDWDDTKSSYPIDKVPQNIDYNKSLFETERLRGQYLKNRLFSELLGNYKVVTDLIATKQSISNR